MSISILNRGASGGLTGQIIVNGLSETDVVTASKDGKIVHGKWKQVKLPEQVPNGYTKLEYIESTGTQHIDTRYKPTNNTRVEIKATSKDGASTRALFGSRKSGSEHAVLLWSRSSEGRVAYAFGAGGTFNTTTVWSTGEIRTFVLKNGSLSIDENITSFTSTSSFSSAYSLMLMALNDGGNIDSRKFVGYVYYAKIYEGTELVRDYVPVKRNFDGAVGLYDLVNNAFYTNEGTGEFIAGAEVSQYAYRHEITGIKDTGLWIVTATDGEQTKSVEVLIDTIGQYEVNITYKLWLLDYETGLDNIAGTYNVTKVTGSVSFSKQSDGSYLLTSSGGSSSQGTDFLVAVPIDVTEYEALCALVDVSAGNSSNQVSFKVCTRNVSYSDIGTYSEFGFYKGTTGNNVTLTTEEKVASSLSDFNYFGIHGYTTGGTVSVTLKKLWLE